VTVAFTASGDVSDYDTARQDLIKTVLAGEANVAPGAVALTITAASVTISATIAVADEATATSTAASLSSGIFASSSTLETALANGGVTVTIATIDTAPTVATVGSSSGSSDSGCGAGCIGGIVGGCFVPILVLILWVARRRQKAEPTSPTMMAKTAAV